MEPFACPLCRFILILPAYYGGRHMDCPHCEEEILVPLDEEGRERQPCVKKSPPREVAGP